MADPITLAYGAYATSPAWLPYLLALGAGGTYVMNRDKINRMAGSFNIPWPGSSTNEDEILWRDGTVTDGKGTVCLLYTSPSPRDVEESRMPSSA